MPMPATVNGRPVKTGSWTPQEDKLLADWQAKLGNRWSAVAKKISGRTGQQCAQRWRHKVNPHIKKEKWTDDEDDRLAMLVRQFGSAWAEIARRMRGRTDQQCMGRWRRHLDPSIRREAWGSNEDALLVRMYQEYGSQWSRISKAVAGRTAQQCRARWFQLQPNDGAETRMLPPGRNSARRPSRRSQNDDCDDEEDEDDFGDDYDEEEDIGDDEGEGSGAGDEEGRPRRGGSAAEGSDGGYDDRGRQHHILPLASARGPNRMYAPRDRVVGLGRAGQLGRQTLAGTIDRLPGPQLKTEPRLGADPATPMPKSLSPLHQLPHRSQSSRHKGHTSSHRPGVLQGQHNRMSDSWVSSDTVLRKPGHHQSRHFASSSAFPWIGGNPNGDDTSAPPTPAGRTLGQRGANPPDELSPPAMLGSPLSRQTGRRAEAQLLNGQSSPLPWKAQPAPPGERLFASPSPRKRPAPGALPIGASPLRHGSRQPPVFPSLPLDDLNKPRIGPHNGFNTPGNICLGPAAATATPPKDSSAQPPRVLDGHSSPHASQSPLPNGYNSPSETSGPLPEGSSQETDAADGTLPATTSTAAASDHISPLFGGPRPSPGQYWRSSPTNSVLSLLRSPTGGPAYKADLLASPDFSALVHSPGSAEKLAAATAAGVPLHKALANLVSQQGRAGAASSQAAIQTADDADENSAGPASWCNRKVVRKLINAAPGHPGVVALSARNGAKSDDQSSGDGGSESPTKKSRSDLLAVKPLQTHQPSRLQESSAVMRPRSEQARQRLLAMMDAI